MFDDYLHGLGERLAGQLAPAAAWRARSLALAREAVARDGRRAACAAALAALPDIGIVAREWHTGVVATAEPVPPPAVADALRAVLLTLAPWRKGPFSIAGVLVDAEWRADWKWARVLPHISALDGRLVLDVGCGNGYYTWRMLGAGAAYVLGLDPSVPALAQFLAVRRYLRPPGGGIPDSDVLSVPSAALDEPLACFDTAFSMGVLYHRREPLAHLEELRRALRTGGELVLETLVIDHGGHEVLFPAGRYAQMRNVHAVPSCLVVEAWLRTAGFTTVRCVDRTPTTTAEQRATAWMQSASLADFLDPHDAARTVEGYPAPLRAVFIARAA